MTSTPFPTKPPDGRGAGATWVAATGAFLLLASATVFVAVRWDQLPEAVKVTLLGAITGGFLAGGRALRRTLPATGDVLFHLGALLIPIDVAALSLRLDLGWRTMLLAEGIAGVAVLGALARAADSVVLTTAAGASVVGLAAGLAAVSPAPAPLLLAGAAVGAHLLGGALGSERLARRAAIAWATVAGLAPVAGALVTAWLRVGGVSGTGVLEELGLGGRSATLLAVASGAVAAVVLGREAARRHDLALVALAGTCLTAGAATTWVNAAPSREAAFLALPALFLLVQAAAMLCERDLFWRRPARAVALAGEVAAAVLAAPVAMLLLALAPFVEEGLNVFGSSPPWQPEPVAAVAWSLLAGGWLLAAWRRLGPTGSPLEALRAAVADDRTVVFLATALGAAAVVGSASTVVIGATLVVLAAGLVASRSAVGTVLAVFGVAWAPIIVAGSHRTAALPLGLAGAAVLGLAAVRWSTSGRGEASAALAGAGSFVAFGACEAVQRDIGLPIAMVTAVVAAWALALLVERSAPLAGHVARATMLLGLAGALAGDAAGILPVAAAVTALFALDAARHDEPFVALGASVSLPLLVGATTVASGIGLAATGVALCISAVACCAVASLYPARWRLPFVVAGAVALGSGLALASADGARFAEALVLTGGLAVAAGLLLGNGLVGHCGGAVIALGVGIHLLVDEVAALEPFVAPVAVQLLVAGWQLRRGPATAGSPPAGAGTSSWVAYGPAIGLLGGAALVERIAGGGAWHGLVAGAVGVAAVAAGGWRRQAGPLFLGTGLVVTVTVLESLATLAGVPTWAWLAAGGTILLGTGVALERSATSPVEAGRRLVDVVEERFS